VPDVTSNPVDYAIYTVHGVFWGSFFLTRLVLRRRNPNDGGDADASTADGETTARFSRGLLAFHSLAFAAMYTGMAFAIMPGRVPDWFPGQRVAGTLVILTGAVLMASALVYFRSWRFRATLEEGHQLATGGPFRILRHPIYMGLNLLALGSAVWVPTPIVWAGFALMVIGSDLRARAEETILEHAFGRPYRDYCARTHRFVPGVY
jgi:protein-S-isoprenylcysteine O-methyltransferase Ste14